VTRRSRSRRARLAGLSLAAGLVAASSALASLPTRPAAAGSNGGSREHQALLELYALDTRLQASQARVAYLATEAAQEMALRITREEGLYVGVSAGAAICAALQLAATIECGTIVAVCPDGGARYQSEKFWEAK